jgi:hypothetical protein
MPTVPVFAQYEGESAEPEAPVIEAESKGEEVSYTEESGSDESVVNQEDDE